MARPRKHGQGRINATVRFTPQRHEELKAAAEASGRSVSEEVEFRIERLASYEKLIELFDKASEGVGLEEKFRTVSFWHKPELKPLPGPP